MSTSTWDRIAVYFHEITLKGGNRKRFTTRLRNNLDRVVGPLGAKVSQRPDRLFIIPEPTRFDETLRAASAVVGIAQLAPIRDLSGSPEDFCSAAIERYRAAGHPGATFAIQMKRTNKAYPMSSQDLQVQIGSAVNVATNAPVNLSNPDVPIPFRIAENDIYMEGTRVPGPGGLPSGVTGKVLTLFSGGIDSPAAAWLAMRRGCTMDFVHFHIFPTAEAIRDTKIPSLIERLIRPQGLRARLHLIPYHPFQMALLGTNIPESMELILFRRFMMRTADRLAESVNLPALVTGDNIGQVASQTLENLVAVDEVATRPVFRPVLTYDKMEIVALTRKIGTYEASIEEYKDCCSLVSTRPDTKPKLEYVARTESRLPFEKIAQQALDEAEVWKLD